MSRYKFSATERYAVFVIHGEECYLCSNPLDLKSMHIDHIIPESLLDRPNELNNVLNEAGLPPKFNLNSYENWMPADAICNIRKSNTIFKLTPMIQLLLQKAKDKASKAQEIATKIVTERKIANALNVLQRAKMAGILTPKHLENIAPLVNFHYEVIGIANKPLILTPYMMAIPGSSKHYKDVLTKSSNYNAVENVDGIIFMKPVNGPFQLESYVFTSPSKQSDFISENNPFISIFNHDFYQENPIKNPYSFEEPTICSKCGSVLPISTLNCNFCDNAELGSNDINI